MTWTIAQLEQMLHGHRSELQKLQRDRAKVARRLDGLDRRIRALGGEVGGRGRNGMGRRGRRVAAGGGGRVRNEKSLNDMISGVLTKAGKPLSVGDITVAVRAGGYKSNSANFRSIVNQTLIKDKRFTAADRGVYQLKK
jgi:hypothetical protein